MINIHNGGSMNYYWKRQTPVGIWFKVENIMKTSITKNSEHGFLYFFYYINRKKLRKEEEITHNWRIKRKYHLGDWVQHRLSRWTPEVGQRKHGRCYLGFFSLVERGSPGGTLLWTSVLRGFKVPELFSPTSGAHAMGLGAQAGRHYPPFLGSAWGSF